MAKDRRGVPVGLLILAPPMLAALYFASLWLPYKLAGWVPPDVLLRPMAWFALTVFEPLARMGSWRPYDVDGWAFAGIFCAAWSAAFLPVGLILGGLAALANAIVFRGGASAEEG